MDNPGLFRLAVAAVALAAVVVVAFTSLRGWWRGTTQLSPSTPPPGWVWGATSWQRLARALPVSLLVGGLAASAILLSAVDRSASAVLVGAAVVAALVWVSVVVAARPRSLIPPGWRPAPHDTRRP